MVLASLQSTPLQFWLKTREAMDIHLKEEKEKRKRKEKGGGGEEREGGTEGHNA